MLAQSPLSPPLPLPRCDVFGISPFIHVLTHHPIHHIRAIRAGPEISAGFAVSRRCQNVSSWRSLSSVPALVPASSALAHAVSLAPYLSPCAPVFYGDAKNREIDGPSHGLIAIDTGCTPKVRASVDQLHARLVRSRSPRPSPWPRDMAAGTRPTAGRRADGGPRGRGEQAHKPASPQSSRPRHRAPRAEPGTTSGRGSNAKRKR